MADDATGIDFPELIQWLDHYLVSIDLETRRILFASTGAAGRLRPGTSLELRGATLEAFLARLFPDEATREQMRRLLDGDAGTEPSFEYRAGDPGAARWRRATVGILKHADGRPARLDLVSVDITELVESRRATARSEALRRIGERVHGAASLTDAIEIVCSEVREALASSRCVLFLFDDASGAVSVAGTSQSPGHGVLPPLATRERMTAAQAVYGRLAQFPDISLAPDLPHFDYLIGAGIRSLATAAIGSGAQPLGMLVVSVVGAERHFDADEMALLEAVANLIAGPLARAVLAEEKARAAAALAAAEERMQAALDATATGVWAFDLVANTLTWDARCFALWELDPAHGPSTNEVNRRIHPDDQGPFMSALSAALDPAGNGELSMTYRYLGPSGVPRWLAARGRCFFTTERLPRKLLGTVTDVTAQHRAEAERRAIEGRYREMVEAMAEGVGLLDAVGRVTFANRAYARIFGYEDEASLVGLHIEDLMFPEDREPERERWLAHVAAGGHAMRSIRRFRAKDAREVWVSLASVPMREEGVVTGILGVVTDVTAARRLESKLQQTQKLESLGVLAGGIAHDFNNLLVGILGNAGIARLELPPDSGASAAIASIETAAVRAAELTRQLLAYAGKGRFVVGRIDLRRLVEEMGHLLASVIRKGVSLQYRFRDALPPIEGDATQLRQVVMNLITNASDAIGDGNGVVTLTTSLLERDAAHAAGWVLDDELAAGPYVCLEVSDTGAGMSPETRARIFEPFFTTKFTGRGLGLAAVLGIVRAHRGAIEVESELGRGTTIRMLLPATQGSVEWARPAALETPVAPIRRTVLVVDDEEIVRKVVKRVLEKAGYDVLTAADGVDGLAVLEANAGAIAVVVLDLTMPRMGGEETFRRMRAAHPGVRVLLSSGYSEQEMTSQFAGEGVSGFLEKPFTPESLLERVSAAIVHDRP